MGPQGADLDDKSIRLYSLSRRFRKSQSRGRFRPSQARKSNFSELNSLDGHETGAQGTDLDENFGTPYRFDGDSENRNPEADFGLPKFENSSSRVLSLVFSPGTFFQAIPCARIAGATFL